MRKIPNRLIVFLCIAAVLGVVVGILIDKAGTNFTEDLPLTANNVAGTLAVPLTLLAALILVDMLLAREESRRKARERFYLTATILSAARRDLILGGYLVSGRPPGSVDEAVDLSRRSLKEMHRQPLNDPLRLPKGWQYYPGDFAGRAIDLPAPVEDVLVNRAKFAAWIAGVMRTRDRVGTYADWLEDGDAFMFVHLFDEYVDGSDILRDATLGLSVLDEAVADVDFKARIEIAGALELLGAQYLHFDQDQEANPEYKDRLSAVETLRANAA